MTEAEMIEAARANVERHLGDCFELEDEPSIDTIYSEAFTLAVDKLHDLGVDFTEAGRIAEKVAQMYAQP